MFRPVHNGAAEIAAPLDDTDTESPDVHLCGVGELLPGVTVIPDGGYYVNDGALTAVPAPYGIPSPIVRCVSVCLSVCG